MLNVHAALPSLTFAALLAAPLAAQDCPELAGQWPHDTATFVTQQGSLAFLGHNSLIMVADVFFGIEHAYAANREGGLLVFERCELPVFSDGFESGDTTEWSLTVP